MNNKNNLVIKFLKKQLGNITVKEFVKRKNWKQDPNFVHRLMNDDLLPDDYKHLYDKLSDCKHKSDNRRAREYGEELVRNWIIEDLIAEILSINGLIVSLGGEDSKREFLSETTADADIEAEINGETYQIEIATDYSGFWKRTGNADFRDNKLQSIKQHENALIIGIDLENHIAFVKNPHETNPKYLEEHPHWGKSAYRFNVNDEDFCEIDKIAERVKNSA